MQNETGMAALRRAIALLGNQAKASRAIGVTPQAVSKVLRRGRRVPAEWCLRLGTGDRRGGHGGGFAARPLSERR